jgi:phosphatidylserine/phosphatidylglycerophosphate/cardiolipin synthase-like enzyme
MPQRALVNRWAAAALALTVAGCGGDDGGGGDGGGDDGGLDGSSCDPAAPRALSPDVLVGPGGGAQGLEERVIAAIDAATTSIDVQMYTFTVDRVADRLIAADGRGAPVRVILDANQVGAASTRSRLENGGVDVTYAPSGFPNAHAKYMVLDGATAFILSANFTLSGFDDQRNYAVIDRDAADVGDLAAVFAADWSGQPAALGCTRLQVTPGDARTRLLALIAAATTTLDAELFYLSDSAVRQAIISAHQRGVAVRVLLADPADMSENATTATTLTGAGVAVKVLANPTVHAKLVIADGVALIGSHNMSPTSLRDNREIGVLVREGNGPDLARTQFDSDWAAARSW